MKSEKTPKHKKHASISIFNKVDVHVDQPTSPPIQQNTTTNTQTNEDGCSACFKAMFKALKR